MHYIKNRYDPFYKVYSDTGHVSYHSTKAKAQAQISLLLAISQYSNNK
jgi:hypothetical protein